MSRHGLGSIPQRLVFFAFLVIITTTIGGIFRIFLVCILLFLNVQGNGAGSTFSRHGEYQIGAIFAQSDDYYVTQPEGVVLVLLCFGLLVY